MAFDNSTRKHPLNESLEDHYLVVRNKAQHSRAGNFSTRRPPAISTTLDYEYNKDIFAKRSRKNSSRNVIPVWQEKGRPSTQCAGAARCSPSRWPNQRRASDRASCRTSTSQRCPRSGKGCSYTAEICWLEWLWHRRGSDVYKPRAWASRRFSAGKPCTIIYSIYTICQAS